MCVLPACKQAANPCYTRCPLDNNNTADNELMTAIGDRCEAALEALYRRYSVRCLSLARRILRDDHIAEEVLQDAFCTLWRSPTRFDPAKGAFSTWLLTTVHHRSVDALRRERRNPVATSIIEREAQPLVDDQAIVDLAAGHVRKTLLSLPKQLREPLILAYFAGYTQQEIADLTGTPLGTIKTHTRRALIALRTRLVDLADGPAATFADAPAQSPTTVNDRRSELNVSRRAA